MCKNSCNKRMLTRSELQLLQSILAQELRFLEEDKQVQRKMIEHCWNRSDPTQPNSSEHFVALNAHKDLLRSLKRRHTNIANVQHSIKRALG